MRFSRNAVLAAGLGVYVGFAAPGAARGQSDVGRFERQMEQLQRNTLIQVDPSLSVDQRAFFDYGAFVTFGYLSADDNNNDNHVLRQFDGAVYANLNIDGAHQFFVRGGWGYRDFNEGDSFDGKGDEPVDGDVNAWFYRFDLQRYEAAYYGRKIDYNLVFKGGQDLYIWGNGVALSTGLQGISTTASWGGNDLTFLAGVTPTRTVDWDTSRPGFDYNTRRGYYGLQLSHQIGTHTPFVYGLLQRDYNTKDTLVTGPVTTHYDYNSYYLGAGSSGSIGNRILYGVEGVYEGGTNLSNSFTSGGGPFIVPIKQTRDQVQAWAGDANIQYLFPDVRHTRASAEVILASGDSDRGISTNTFNGNKPGTFDNAFNGLGLLNTGLSFAPAVSNLLVFRVGGSTFPLYDTGPLRRAQLGVDFFLYNKMITNGPIDEPTIGDNRYLGCEPDVSLNWQITSDVTLIARYGVFFPSSESFRSTDARQYIYAGVTYAF